MAKRRKSSSPAKQAIPGAGKGGVIPPEEHRFKPGESGNPAGRQPAGLSVREWYNAMKEWPLDKIEAVTKDKSQPADKIAAAWEWVTACNGESRNVAGNSMDRIFDRTIGKPTQALELTGKDGGALEVNQTIDLSKLSTDELRTWRELRLKASAGTNN